MALLLLPIKATHRQALVVKGELLELSVEIDGEKVIETSRLWYPLPSSLVKRTREFLDGKAH